MSRQQFSICYLTKKPNAIAGIAALLRPAFPVLAASQVISIEDIPANKMPDMLIADAKPGEIGVPIPTLYVIPSKDASRLFGHTNYITEDELLTHALVRAVKNILESEKLANELKETSVKDELTGLYNQRYLVDALAKEVKKAGRYRIPLTLLCIGIDGLREINERHGHATGDKVIVDLGLLIANSVRDVDTVGRFWGDEFLAILPETSPNDALKVCTRIQRATKNFAFAGGVAGLNVTASTGIAALTTSIRTKDALLEASRSALAAAKKRGAGNMCSFEEAHLVNEPIKENQELITSVQQQITFLTDDAKKNHLGGILKLFEDIPLYKKLHGHATHTAFYAERLAIKMGIAEEDDAAIRYGALLHDIGMLAIDERIVLKQGPLSGIEYTLVKQHPLIASQMLIRSIFIKNEMNIVLHHHEWFDGNGYPDHLRGTHIPMGSRIIALAESWDTMITPQSYRPALPLDEGLKELKKGAGKQFDPELVAVFAGLIEG